MNYYKVIKESTIVGAGLSYDFRKFQMKHKVLLICDEQEAQYIQYRDKLYRDEWMAPITDSSLESENATIVQIDEQEYDTIKSALESDEEIIIEQEEHEEPENNENGETDPIEEITIDYIRNSKIREMSNECNKIIVKGFDVILSDGVSYHFSLTTQDQLNLITLSSLIDGGETQIPYHADGELCKFYSVNDIKTIIDKATKYKTYHVSYFNSLKSYIETMNGMNEIREVYYGIEIPEENQSDVLKVLSEG